MLQTLRLLLVTLLLMSGPVIAQDYVPEALEGWQQWVLKDTAYRDCPFYFDRTPANRSYFLCAWPGQLQLDVTTDGARFEQRWTLYEEDQWIALPGSPEHWPDQVTLNGSPIEVIERDGSAVFLGGNGASPDGDRPFLRRVDVETREFVGEISTPGCATCPRRRRHGATAFATCSATSTRTPTAPSTS